MTKEAIQEIEKHISKNPVVCKESDDAIPFIVIPNHCSLHNVEKFMEAPVRKRANEKFDDLESLIDYIGIHQEDSTTLRINKDRISCIIDDHCSSSPRNREHQAHLYFTLSPDWIAWRCRDTAPLTQSAFIDWVEDQSHCFVAPSGATMLELAQSLSAKKSVDFKSGIRIQDGNVQLTYEETTTAKAGEKGNLTIPQIIDIAVPYLANGTPYRMQARLRYRINDSKLSFTYKLIRPELIVEDVIKELTLRIEKALGILPLRG